MRVAQQVESAAKRRRLAALGGNDAASRGTRHAAHAATSGSSAPKTKAARKPTWSISNPTTTGATVFDSAGPSATQLKTRFKSLASRAIRPASR